jgi:hypothetical protein
VEDAAPALNGLSTCGANRSCGFELMNGAHDPLARKNPFRNLKSAAARASPRPTRARFTSRRRRRDASFRARTSRERRIFCEKHIKTHNICG